MVEKKRKRRKRLARPHEFRWRTLDGTQRKRSFCVARERDAFAREVLDLVAQIKDTAMHERGVTLEMEVKVIGEDQPLPL